jgi:hypothetical protein
MARRLENRFETVDGCLIQQSGVIAKESGEAIAAILAAEQSCGADEQAQAIKEIDDAMQALRLARSRLEENARTKGAGI